MQAAILDQDVAKKRPKSKSAQSSSAPIDRKPMVVQLRGTAEFKAALEKAAERMGINVTTYVDLAIRHYTEHLGYADIKIPKR